MPTSPLLDRVGTLVADTTSRIAGMEALDRVGDPLQRVVQRTLGSGSLGQTLRGDWLGHPVHPALTDLPIGFWTASWVLDFGGRRGRGASDVMIAAGLLAVVPTALAGLVDWADRDAPDRRLGLAHLAANSAASLLYTASLAARLRRKRARGIALAWAGAATATVGAAAGGHLAFAGAK